MAEITFEESIRQTRELERCAREAARVGDVDTAISTWHRLLAHPCAHHQVIVYEVWDDIYSLHRRTGNYGAAIDAKRTAIDLGYRSAPDPEADIAECHLAAGRRGEADRMFAELRARTPDDVWLYNAAGVSYAEAGDHRAAARWLRDGIAVALRTGDPDQVVTQLLDFLDASLDALGEQPDAELTRRVDEFCQGWEPTETTRWWGEELIEEDRACGYCGFDPLRSDDEMNERARRNRERILRAEAPEVLARLDALGSRDTRHTRLGKDAALSVAWFPAAEWDIAIGRWPDLLDELPRDHAAYSREIEARVKQLARSLPGQSIRIAPLTVERLIVHADAHRQDPSSAEARASSAAELVGMGEARTWPPGRNEHCWCDSDRKYKQCCAPVHAAVERTAGRV